MQMLTTEAAQAEIINEDFTSSEAVLPLPSFDQSLQHLLQQASWWWTIQSLPWPCRASGQAVYWPPTPSEVDLNLKNELGDVFQD